MDIYPKNQFNFKKYICVRTINSTAVLYYYSTIVVSTQDSLLGLPRRRMQQLPKAMLVPAFAVDRDAVLCG